MCWNQHLSLLCFISLPRLGLYRDAEAQFRSALRQFQSIDTYLLLGKVCIKIDQPLSALDLYAEVHKGERLNWVERWLSFFFASLLPGAWEIPQRYQSSDRDRQNTWSQSTPRVERSFIYVHSMHFYTHAHMLTQYMCIHGCTTWTLGTERSGQGTGFL